MLTVVVAFSIMIGEIYHEGRSNMQREIAQEAEYLSDCIAFSDYSAGKKEAISSSWEICKTRPGQR